VTTRRCQPGEQVQIRRLSTNVWLQARVVYCHPLDHGEFFVGLEFRAGALDGEARPAYADFFVVRDGLIYKPADTVSTTAEKSPQKKIALH
jgi:hypothetical protein